MRRAHGDAVQPPQRPTRAARPRLRHRRHPDARAGPAAEALRAAADDYEADVVAVGTRGRGWAARLFLGSVAASTLRHAGQTVLVCPAPPAAERVRSEFALHGSLATRRPDDWPAALDEFTRHNAGRPARLDVAEPAHGTPRVAADGLTFVGAAVDPRAECVTITLGDAPSDAARPGARRLTHTVGPVAMLEIFAEPGGATRDAALVVDGTRGTTVLTFAR